MTAGRARNIWGKMVIPTIEISHRIDANNLNGININFNDIHDAANGYRKAGCVYNYL